MPLKNRVRELRIKAGLTQEALADKLGVSRNLVTAWESGAKVPTYNGLVALATLFNVTTDYLLLGRVG